MALARISIVVSNNPNSMHKRRWMILLDLSVCVYTECIVGICGVEDSRGERSRDEWKIVVEMRVSLWTTLCVEKREGKREREYMLSETETGNNDGTTAKMIRQEKTTKRRKRRGREDAGCHAMMVKR